MFFFQKVPEGNQDSPLPQYPMGSMYFIVIIKKQENPIVTF